MSTVPNRSRWHRVKVWIGPVLWLVMIGLTVCGSFDVWGAGGLPLLLGSIIWSITVWSGFFWIIFKRMRRFAADPRCFEADASGALIGFLLLLLATFVLTTIAPGVAAGIKWRPEAGIGVASIGITAFIVPVLLMLLVNLPRALKDGRFNRELTRFKAKFDSGPIGVWRADLPPRGIEVEPGCQIVFAAGGHGYVLEWKTAADESNPSVRQFAWKQIDKELIEVKCNKPNLTAELVVPRFIAWGRELPLVVRLVLFKKDAMHLVEPEPETVGSAEDQFWPGVFFFAYRGEPPNSQSIEPRAA